MLSRTPFLLLYSLLFLVSAASADTIAFDPPGATVNHSVDAIVSAVWRNGCTPSVSHVAVAGSTITLHLNASSSLGPCPQALTSYTATFHLGVLPAGSYMVIAVADANNVSDEVARTTLIVRDAETVTLFPYGVPASGGLILFLNPTGLMDVTFTVDGVTVTPRSNSSGLLMAADLPPHAPGAADLTVNSRFSSFTAKAALVYYDPAAADPAVFERILFPLSFQGAGALGSQWTTESFLYANGSLVYFRDPPPCDGCGNLLTIGSRQLNANSNPWGHVLYCLRGRVPVLAFASRIRDTSRQSQSAGTEVPVVREGDFRGDLRFMNVPLDRRYRVNLRLWSLADYPQFIVANGVIPEQQVPLSVTMIPGTEMWFGTIDVTALLARGNFEPAVITVVPSGYPSNHSPVPYPKIWGMLSITNNDTQQVTIISPH